MEFCLCMRRFLLLPHVFATTVNNDHHMSQEERTVIMMGGKDDPKSSKLRRGCELFRKGAFFLRQGSKATYISANLGFLFHNLSSYQVSYCLKYKKHVFLVQETTDSFTPFRKSELAVKLFFKF